MASMRESTIANSTIANSTIANSYLGVVQGLLGEHAREHVGVDAAVVVSVLGVFGGPEGSVRGPNVGGRVAPLVLGRVIDLQRLYSY